MTTRADAVLEQALSLEPEERAAIAARLLESLGDHGGDQEYERSWTIEIATRLAELDSGAVETVSWESVRQEAANLVHGKRA